MSNADPLAAELAAIERRHAKIKQPGGLRWDFDGGYAANDAEGVGRLLASTDDVPRLLAAVEAVLALHVKQEEPVRSYGPGDSCPQHLMTALGRRNYATMHKCPDCRYTEYFVCEYCDRSNDTWPCPTYAAISSALLGEAGTDGH